MAGARRHAPQAPERLSRACERIPARTAGDARDAARFALLCLRQAPAAGGATPWDLVTDPSARSAVGVVDQWLAGRAGARHLREAADAADEVAGSPEGARHLATGVRAALLCAEAAVAAAEGAARAAEKAADPAAEADAAGEAVSCACLAAFYAWRAAAEGEEAAAEARILELLSGVWPGLAR
jgi:hypothetical protein